MQLNLFELPAEKLQEMMLTYTHATNVYQECFNILLLRSHARLIDKTEALVRQTRWLAVATWAVAVATIITIVVHS